MDLCLILLRNNVSKPYCKATNCSRLTFRDSNYCYQHNNQEDILVTETALLLREGMSESEIMKYLIKNSMLEINCTSDDWIDLLERGRKINQIEKSSSIHSSNKTSGGDKERFKKTSNQINDNSNGNSVLKSIMLPLKLLLKWWWNDTKDNFFFDFLGGGKEGQKAQEAFDYIRTKGESSRNRKNTERNIQNNDSNFYKSGTVYTCINGHQLNSIQTPKKCPFCDKSMYPL